MQKTRIDNQAAIIVAHPDDETIWCGGTLFMHAHRSLSIVSLCRASDPDRAPKFYRAVSILGGRGCMGDLDDGPEQHPLPESTIQATILDLLPTHRFDIIITHSPLGEYTRHRRHEETATAVGNLWKSGRLKSKNLWMFAYRDQGRGGVSDPPVPHPHAHIKICLPKEIYCRKKRIILDCYGFLPDGFEALACGKQEAFWCFENPDALMKWLFEYERSQV